MYSRQVGPFRRRVSRCCRLKRCGRNRLTFSVHGSAEVLTTKSSVHRASLVSGLLMANGTTIAGRVLFSAAIPGLSNICEVVLHGDGLSSDNFEAWKASNGHHVCQRTFMKHTSRQRFRGLGLCQNKFRSLRSSCHKCKVKFACSLGNWETVKLRFAQGLA